MRSHSHLIWATLTGALLFGVGQAIGAPLPCDVETPTECQISTLQNVGGGGTFEVDRTLHIGSGGEIRTNPGSTLTLDIAGGFIVDAAGKITGNAAATGNSSGATVSITAAGPVFLGGNGISGAVISADQPGPASCSGGTGGIISLTSTFVSETGSIIMESGSRISVNARCSAGEILISATQGGVDIRGIVESASTLSGVGSKQPPGGGPITISASCTLIVNDTGQVRSWGRDPGADLVHLEAGRDVRVLGLVESTGDGHAIPNTPANHCSGPGRPDKPANTTACVEIWAGKTLTIDSTGSNHGEINANLPLAGAFAVAWIDLFAKGNITIDGIGTGPYAVGASPYAVHAANQNATNSHGGIIAVKSVAGQVRLSGQAIQADAQLPGGAGGIVVIEAGGERAVGGDVDLGPASVRARGANTGGNPQGGNIAVRSFSGRVVGLAPGELDASGVGGTVTLQGCDTVNYSGAATPVAFIGGPSCGGNLSIPAYVAFPSSACDPLPCVGPSCPCVGPSCPCVGPDCPCVGPSCPCVGAELPVRGAGLPVRGAELPVRGVGLPVRGAELPVRGVGLPVRGAGLPVRGAELSVRGAGLPVRGAELSVRGAGLSVRGAELSVRGAELSVRGAELSVRGAELPVRGAELPVRGAELSVRGAELPVRGAELSVRGAELSVRGAELSVRGAELSVRGAGLLQNLLRAGVGECGAGPDHRAIPGQPRAGRRGRLAHQLAAGGDRLRERHE